MQRLDHTKHGPHVLDHTKHGPHVLDHTKHGPHMLDHTRHGPHVQVPLSRAYDPLLKNPALSRYTINDAIAAVEQQFQGKVGATCKLAQWDGWARPRSLLQRFSPRKPPWLSLLRPGCGACAPQIGAL